MIWNNFKRLCYPDLAMSADLCLGECKFVNASKQIPSDYCTPLQFSTIERDAGLCDACGRRSMVEVRYIFSVEAQAAGRDS